MNALQVDNVNCFWYLGFHRFCIKWYLLQILGTHYLKENQTTKKEKEGEKNLSESKITTHFYIFFLCSHSFTKCSFSRSSAFIRIVSSFVSAHSGKIQSRQFHLLLSYLSMMAAVRSLCLAVSLFAIVLRGIAFLNSHFLFFFICSFLFLPCWCHCVSVCAYKTPNCFGADFSWKLYNRNFIRNGMVFSQFGPLLDFFIWCMNIAT